jgi:hypothetical protein
VRCRGYAAEPSGSVADLCKLLRSNPTQQKGARMSDASNRKDSFLQRLEAVDDVAPAGTSRRAVPVRVGDTTYAGGIPEVPLEELALASKADVEAMGFAQRSHRTRRLKEAVRKGEFSPEQVAALKAKGVLPAEL